MAKSQYKIVARQGDDQYLIIFYGSDDKFGQIYDAESQDLLPPRSINSLFSKGTWEAIDDENQIPSSIKINIDYLIPEEKESPVSKGDVAGHEFHGNQWTGGQGSASLGSFKESFDKAFAGSPFSAFVNHYSLEEMKSEGMKPLLSADGKTGLLIHDHGDGRIEATALFNNGESGAGLQLLKNAIDNHGVNYVECFGPALPVMYGKLGFEVESQNSFDPQYAPTDWNYDKFGTPDYYTMRITK